MPRKFTFGILASLVVCVALGASAVRAADENDVGVGPAPSPTPISWELEFQFLDPRRIEAQFAGRTEVYWYMVYTVVNTSGRTQRFFPTFQLVTEELKLLDTDTGIPAVVFDAIAERHRLTHPRLVHPTKAIGELKAGNDYALESVAIWRQGDVRVNNFTIYVAGLSGETRFVGAHRGAHAAAAIPAGPRAGSGKGAKSRKADSDADAGEKDGDAKDASVEGEGKDTPKSEKDASVESGSAAAPKPAAGSDKPAAASDKPAAAKAADADAPGGAPAGAAKRDTRQYVLRKTLELKYTVAGSPDARLVAEPVRRSVRWVMR